MTKTQPAKKPVTNPGHYVARERIGAFSGMRGYSIEDAATGKQRAFLWLAADGTEEQVAGAILQAMNARTAQNKL